MNAPRLEYIEIDGYKSFRKLAKFEMRKGLNVLIGANGSGKTNFLSFFELLGNMMDENKGLQNYIAKNVDADAFLFRGMKITPAFRARIGYNITDWGKEYDFELSAAADRSMFFADEFRFTHTILSTGEQWRGHQEGHFRGHKESRFQKRLKQDVTQIFLGPILELGDIINNGRIYHFHDTSYSANVMGRCNIVDNDTLHGDGRNVSAVLLRIRDNKREYYDRILKIIRLAAPFFGDFVLKEISQGQGQTQLLWKERYSDLIFYPHQLSDGTLRFICLATLLLQPNPPSLIIIDEPELGLHPYALSILAGLLRQAAAESQIIVSTQSRALVDEFEPEDIIVADRANGETTLHRCTREELAKWLEDYSLGELWEKNVLGGRPQS